MRDNTQTVYEAERGAFKVTSDGEVWTFSFAGQSPSFACHRGVAADVASALLRSLGRDDEVYVMRRV